MTNINNTGLAAQIEADLLGRGRGSNTKTTHCALCGAGMVYKGRDHCSDRCAQYAADGFPVADPAYGRKVFEAPLRSWSVIAGTPDDQIGSSHYGRVFDRRDPKFKKPGDGSIRMKPTATGFMIQCAKCGDDFESHGTSRHDGCKGAAMRLAA